MKLTTKEIIVCGLFASITAVLSQISIPLPFTTVPITMQVFAVMLTGLLLGPKLGTISQVIYVLLGSIGIPVFAQMSGGMGIVLGPTGGFILSFPLLALIVGYFAKKYKSKPMVFVGMIVGVLVNYLVGTLQFCFVTNMNFMAGLMACVVPFVAVDILKIILAYIIGTSINKRIKLGV